MVESGRLTPALVPPVGTAIGKHAGEVARSGDARPGKAGAGVGVGPGVAAVGGPVDEVHVGVGEATAAFVHAGDIDVACGQVAGDLDVADEGGAGSDLSLVGPGRSVVSGVLDVDALASSEIVPGNVHAAKEGAARVVVGPAGLAVVATAAVNAKVGPASRRRVRWSGGLVPAQALTAAGAV